MLGFATSKLSRVSSSSEIQEPDKGSPVKRIFENTVSTTRYFLANVLASSGCSGAAVTTSESRLGTVCLVLVPIILSDETGKRQAVSATPTQCCPSASIVLADKIKWREIAVNSAQ